MHPATQAGIPVPPQSSHDHGDLRGWQVCSAELRAEIERRWGTPHDELATICRHAVLPAGKLLRPLLCLEAAAAVGGLVDQVMPAAVGVEYGHVASLVHDDIIDGDDTRRGHPSVQHEFGIDRAILAGDRLFFAMFQVLTECHDRGVAPDRIVAAQRVFADLADLCHGASVELALCGDISTTVPAYLAMTRLKTAAAIRGACQIGAILGGGTPQQIDALGTYGDELGTAYQIHDDLLPYDQDSLDTGKPGDSDLRNRRPTLPILLAYHTAQAEDRTVIKQMLAGQLTPNTAYRQIREIVHRTGAMDTARHMAHHHITRARDALAALPATPSRTRLTSLTEDMLRHVPDLVETETSRS